MAQETSQLHDLLPFLDTGATSDARRAVARQIGDIAKQHQGELWPLLRGVRQFLRSKRWDTRVAAAQAIGAIAANVPHLTVKDLLASLERVLEIVVYHEREDGALTCRRIVGPPEGFRLVVIINCQVLRHLKVRSGLFGDFVAHCRLVILAACGLDMQGVLENGAQLLSSGGQESDLGVDNSKTLAQRLTRQKADLRRCFGLYGSEEFKDIIDMIRARELNVLKRKAKVLPEDGAGQEEENEEPASKRIKQTKSVDTKEGDADGDWPFYHIVDLLIHDVLDPVWEVRHGSVMALREILSVQAASAGVMAPTVEAEAEPGAEPEAPITPIK